MDSQINMNNRVSKAEQRSFIVFWTAVAALAALLSFGGLYLLQRKRANLSISKNIRFREYEAPEISFNFVNGSAELYVFSKIGLQRDDDKFRDEANLSFCFTPPQDVNLDEKRSPGAEYKDVFKCSKLLPSIDNIFFLETICASGFEQKTPTGLQLTPKQACAIYSAAHHNPHRKVILLFTCPLGREFYTKTKNWVKTLWNLPNFYFGQINLEDFYANTFLLEFYHDVRMYSEFDTVHQADILRLFVLYLYGGTYMDLDVISLRPLDDLGVNFMGFESTDSINNAVMNFEPKHKFLELCLFNAMLRYEPNQWTSIGPIMITKMIRKCNISGNINGSLLHAPSCNITILPVKTFYAVGGGEWSYFYNKNLWPVVEKMLNESYATHYWNHLGRYDLFIGSNQPIIKLAEQHCTGVYNNSGQLLS